MVPTKQCPYSPNRPLGEHLGTFIYHAGCHLIVASAVNGIVLYMLLEADDLFPGVLVGGGAALAQNLTHSLAHLETHYRSDLVESCYLPYCGEIVLGFFLTYFISQGLLNTFDYRAGGGAIARLGAVAMISIAVYNQHQNK